MYRKRRNPVLAMCRTFKSMRRLHKSTFLFSIRVFLDPIVLYFAGEHKRHRRHG